MWQPAWPTFAVKKEKDKAANIKFLSDMALIWIVSNIVSAAISEIVNWVRKGGRRPAEEIPERILVSSATSAAGNLFGVGELAGPTIKALAGQKWYGDATLSSPVYDTLGKIFTPPAELIRAMKSGKSMSDEQALRMLREFSEGTSRLGGIPVEGAINAVEIVKGAVELLGYEI